MVFSSLLFLFIFLPLQLLCYWLIPQKYKNLSLLIFSLIFYSWSGPLYLILLVMDSLITWYSAVKIQDAYNTNKPDKIAKTYLLINCSILVLILVFFKYLGLLSSMINALIGWTGIPAIPLLNIALPIGISFYTFQLLSYTADVYTRKIEANPSFFKILLYASLFHQCIAGPIVRYEVIANEIDERTTDFNKIYKGLRRFSIGLAKKAVLANACAELADTYLSLDPSALSQMSRVGLWFGAICYTLQIYLDFSAYSDMAIGLGYMIGFHYPENFKYPYIANSIKDFWRRWHISLSSFFRDYVYIPLGGNRVSILRNIFNLFVVWGLTGLWHGASVNFIIWGLYYFLFLIIEKYIFKDKTIFIAGHIYTLIAVTVGWVIFRFDSFEPLKIALSGMFGFSDIKFIDLQTTSALKGNIFLILFCIIASTPLYRKLRSMLNNSDNKFAQTLYLAENIILPTILLILSTFALVGNSYNPFLYFRF